MKKNFKKIILSLSLFLSACSSDPVIEKPKPMLATPMKILWKQHEYRGQAEGAKRMLPYVVENKVYTADPRGALHAYYASTGVRVWELDQALLQTNFVTSPVVEKDTVYVGTKQATLVALTQEGDKRWEAHLPSTMQVPAVWGSGLLYVRTQDGSLTAVSEQTGEMVWTYARELPSLTLRVASKPVFSRFGLLMGTADGKLLCLHPETGELLWESLIALPSGRSEVERMVDIVADPLVLGDVVYVATYRGKLAALNLQGGAILWQQDLSTWNDLLALAGQVIVSTTQDDVLSIDKKTGEILWRQEQLQGRGLTKPIATKGAIVVGDQLGQLHYLDLDSGKLQKTTETTSKPIVDLQLLAPLSNEGSEDLLITFDDGKFLRTKL